MYKKSFVSIRQLTYSISYKFVGTIFCVIFFYLCFPGEGSCKKTFLSFCFIFFFFVFVCLGHFRTCSEISSVSCHSESGDSGDTDRLQKKIYELSEILEARETKMVELSRSNLELQEQNLDLARY